MSCTCNEALVLVRLSSTRSGSNLLAWNPFRRRRAHEEFSRGAASAGSAPACSPPPRPDRHLLLLASPRRARRFVGDRFDLKIRGSHGTRTYHSQRPRPSQSGPSRLLQPTCSDRHEYATDWRRGRGRCQRTIPVGAPRSNHTLPSLLRSSFGTGFSLHRSCEIHVGNCDLTEVLRQMMDRTVIEVQG